jgi:hypothetical protein
MQLGHIGERGMLKLHKRNLLKGVKTCKYCVYRKQSRVNFLTGSHTSKGILDYVHSHVWGPISVLLIVVLLTNLLVSLMTTLGRYGFIF